MDVLVLLLFCIAAYLYGSINLALILARHIGGIDIRDTGTRNAGTANIGRTLGRRWAFLVFLFDLSKSLLPMTAAGALLADGDTLAGTIGLLLIALSAVLGHCRPLYYQFKGGGGIVTVMGALCYFVFAEFFISLVLAYIIAELFLRHTQYRIGQWVPILFLSITPVVTLLASLFLDLHIIAGITLGGKPPYLAAVVLVFGLCIILLNQHVFRGKVAEARSFKGKP